MPCRSPAAVSALPLPQDIPLTILFEDADLIVLDKPAGLVVHPAPGNLDGTLVNALLAHAGEDLPGIGGEKRPGIVHRLDKDTSGVMVVAKTERAHRALSEAFATRDLDREYLALVWGLPNPAGRRDRGQRSAATRRPQADGGGRARRQARADPLRHASAPGAAACALLRCRLGNRPHPPDPRPPRRDRPSRWWATRSICGGPRRRQAAWPSRPVRPCSAFPRQALHAATLGFRHPVTGHAAELLGAAAGRISRPCSIAGR